MDRGEPELRIQSLCMDAADPLGLARFWATALRWELRTHGEWVWLEPTGGTTFTIGFQQVSEPKVGQNRAHIDLTTSSVRDQVDTVAELLDAGGRHLDIGQGDVPWVVMEDPEGNELCVIEPDNRFLADCPRLGSISCDGSQQVGYFWSEALGWPLVWDQDEETAIQAPDGGPKITWGGPPVAPKVGKNRLHLDVAPRADIGQDAAVERLVALGAVRVDIGQGDVSWVVMADPDGNELCVLSPR